MVVPSANLETAKVAITISLSPQPVSIRDFSLSTAKFPGEGGGADVLGDHIYSLAVTLSCSCTPYDKGAVVMARVQAADATHWKSGTSEIRVRIRMWDTCAMLG